MTLTMTLAANGLIVQAADHRLIRVADGSLYDDAEPKQLVITGLPRIAMACYAGVGEIPGRGRTSEMIYRAVSDAQDVDSFEDIEEMLRAAATRWMAGVRGARRHSLTIAGFNIRDESTEERTVKVIETHVALISNWQRIAGIEASRVQTEDATEAEAEFTISRLDDWDVGEPVLLASGIHSAVQAGEALRLTRLVRDRRTVRGLAKTLAAVNRSAAGRSTARGSISPHCTTIGALIGRTQINGEALAHSKQGEREVEVPFAALGYDQREALRKFVAESWARHGGKGIPVVARGPFALSIRAGGRGSMYANPNDRLLT